MRKAVLLLFLALAVGFSTAYAINVTPEVILMDPTADIQTAIDALGPNGGVIELGPHTYTLTKPLLINRPVRLTGSGVYSTYLYCADPDSDIVRVTSNGVVLRDLTIYGPASAGDGVGLKLRAPAGDVLRGFSATNITIHSTGSWCCAIFGPGYMDTTLAGGWSGTAIHPVFSRVIFYNNQSGGTLYSGHGVAAPTFTDCNFTGQGYTTPVGGTTTEDSLKAWHWNSSIPAYHYYPTTVLHRGHVYLCVTSAAQFNGCIFQTLSVGSATDEPVLSLEDTHDTRFVNSYFEAFGASNTRQQPFVTMSAAAGFVFENTYVYSPFQAPLHFLRTNSNPSSRCSGVLGGFYALQGSSSYGSLTPGERQNDFVFNTTLDGAGQAPIVLSNVQIQAIDSTGTYWRAADVRQFSGAAAFYTQNVMLQNSSNRFRVPNISYDSLSSAVSNPKRAEMIYVSAPAAGAFTTGSKGRLFLGLDNANWSEVVSMNFHADSAARNVFFKAPYAPEFAYNAADDKLELYTGCGLSSANANNKWTSIAAYYSFADSTVRNDVFPKGSAATTPSIPSFCWLADRLKLQIYTGGGADDGWVDLH